MLRRRLVFWATCGVGPRSRRSTRNSRTSHGLSAATVLGEAPVGGLVEHLQHRVTLGVAAGFRRLEVGQQALRFSIRAWATKAGSASLPLPLRMSRASGSVVLARAVFDRIWPRKSTGGLPPAPAGGSDGRSSSRKRKLLRLAVSAGVRVDRLRHSRARPARRVAWVIVW